MTTAASPQLECPNCGKNTKTVLPLTVRSLLADEAVGRATEAEYRFCGSKDCDAVYFSDGETFTRSELKVPVGVKEVSGDRLLCYCFGHSIASIKAALRNKGRSDALADIRKKMEAPGCHCETSNPSGSCCLGSVRKGIRIAQEELQMNELNGTLAKPAELSVGRGERIAKIGTVVSAIMASSCCWLPLALLAVGVSAAGISSTLDAYRPLFIAVTFGFLAVAFYFTYQPKKAAFKAGRGCCPPDPTAGGDAESHCCTPSQEGRFSMVAMNKVMLWGVTMMAIAFLLFPHYVGTLLGTAGGATAVVTPDMNRAVLQIEGMACHGCEAVAEKAIRTVPGVLAIETSYEKAEAVIGFDGSRDIHRNEILAALERVGYQGRFTDAAPNRRGNQWSKASQVDDP